MKFLTHWRVATRVIAVTLFGGALLILSAMPARAFTPAEAMLLVSFARGGNHIALGLLEEAARIGDPAARAALSEVLGGAQPGNVARFTAPRYGGQPRFLTNPANWNALRTYRRR